MIQSKTVAKYGNALTGLQEGFIQLVLTDTKFSDTEYTASVEHFAVLDTDPLTTTGITTNSGTGKWNGTVINLTIQEYFDLKNTIPTVTGTELEQLLKRREHLLLNWLNTHPMYDVEFEMVELETED